MIVIYKWIISQMDSVPKEGELTDVVITVHWRRSATTVVDEKEYYTDIYGAQSFTQTESENFTPYDQLTYEQICGWLDGSMDVAAIDLSLYNQLENLINPPIIVLPLPWITPQPVEPTPTPTETLPEPTPTPTETLPEPTPTPTETTI